MFKKTADLVKEGTPYHVFRYGHVVIWEKAAQENPPSEVYTQWAVLALEVSWCGYIQGMVDYLLWT